MYNDSTSSENDAYNTCNKTKKPWIYIFNNFIYIILGSMFGLGFH